MSRPKSQFDDQDIIIPVVLVDTAKQGKSKKTERKARVRINSFGINIAVEGFGDCSTIDGFGEPIFIEFYDGKLTVRVNADINREEASHVIDMDGALEVKRAKEMA